MFDVDVFHMGGDEVNVNCWASSPEFQAYMKNTGKEGTHDDYKDLWRKFQRNAYLKMIDARGKRIPAIAWTSDLTSDDIEYNLARDDYIIQNWAAADNVST